MSGIETYALECGDLKISRHSFELLRGLLAKSRALMYFPQTVVQTHPIVRLIVAGTGPQHSLWRFTSTVSGSVYKTSKIWVRKWKPEKLNLNLQPGDSVLQPAND